MTRVESWQPKEKAAKMERSGDKVGMDGQQLFPSFLLNPTITCISIKKLPIFAIQIQMDI